MKPSCGGTGGLHMVTKGEHITASWMRTNLACVAGAQMKLEGQLVTVCGIVRHVRGNDPVNPTTIGIFIDPDDPACDLPRIRPPRCTCPRPHVLVDPGHIDEGGMMNKSCDHPLADGRKAGCACAVRLVCDCNKCRREDPVCACEEHFAAVAEHHRRIYGGLPLWRAILVEPGPGVGRKESMSTIKLGGHSLDTFSIHERRLHLTHHPDAERGQYVLVAVYGNGDSPFGGAHELCICLDDAGRQQLIDVLQSDPEPGH